MIKLRPRYYGVWFGITLGVMFSLSAVVQQYKMVTEQEADLVKTRMELRAFMEARMKEVSAEQVKIDARQFLEMKIDANPTLKDQIYANAEGLLTTQEQSRSYVAFFMSGIVVVLGSLMYLARKKRKFGGTKKWLVLEMIGILVILAHLIYGIVEGVWYEYPIVYIFIPLCVMAAYATLFFIKHVDVSINN